MNYYIFCAEESWDKLSNFRSFLDKNNLQFYFNPDLSELNAINSGQDKCALILFISDNLLKSAPLGRIIHLDLNRFETVIPIITDGHKVIDGNLHLIPTRIGNIHELMQYRDYWYEEWIRLRKSNTAKPDSVSENLVEQTRKISTGIAGFLRTIAGLNPINLETFEKDNFDYFKKTCDINETEEIKNLPIINEIEDDTPNILIPEEIEETALESEIRQEDNQDEELIETNTETDYLETEKSTIEPMESNDLNLSNDDNYESTEKFFEEALEAQKVADFHTARNYLEQILRKEPMHAAALWQLAVLIDLHFENESAEELFRKALFCNEEHADLYYEYARHLSKNAAQLQKASDMYQRAIELNGTEALPYLELAHCQLKIGQKIAAKANYLQACLIDTDTRTVDLDRIFSVYNPSPVSDQEQESIPEPTKNPNENTIVLVTGATSGIGKAIAELFAINGYKVIITGRRQDRLELIKEEFITNFSSRIESLCFDIRDEAAVEQAFTKLPEEWKTIDILINNAGLAKGRAPFHLGNLNHWETMIDTNIKGLLYISRIVSKNMVERQKGFIVNIGSVAGKEAYTDGNVYCATKAAVDMLTKGMRLDLHKYGIRVSAVHPGHVETEFALVRFDGDEQKADIYGNFTPLSAMDVAETVYYIVNRPQHVNIQDVLMFGTQQASATVVDMSGKKYSD
jgi:NADP-dependent 3-hydroxy acid dehydrogenase YdfG